MDVKVKSTKKVEVKEPNHQVFFPGEIGAIIEITVKKKDGTVREHRVMKSKSFVRQFFDLLLLQFLQVPELAPVEVRDTSNNLQALANSFLTFACNAAIGDDAFGVVCGTGTTSPTITDYAMETKIAEGTGVGHLQHGNVAYGVPTASGSVSHFTITRDFSNASGGTITVNEIGLYVKALEALVQRYNSRDDKLYYFMTIRDVIIGGIDVLNGETLTVNYRLQATA